METQTLAGIGTRGIDAHYYLAKDYERGVAFYRDVIGLPVASSGERETEFELPDGSTFGLSYLPGTWYPGGGVMFAVPNVYAAA
ncbi:MAG TPA: VOC family protein, partial [Verrucomicrobiae bacterium]|nr:VOC family protein [Verrucomicrobiae bacterium]